MARGKPTIPDEYLGEISDENSVWFEAYSENHPIGPTPKVKVGKILRYKEINQISIQDFSLKEIREFKDMMEERTYKPSGIEPYIRNFSGFAKFLRENHKDEFPETFLLNINDVINELDEEKNALGTSDKSLSPMQINLIRKYNKENGTVYDEYIFEVFFQLGIQGKELQLCQPKFQHPNKPCFTPQKGNNIFYNTVISTILKKIKEVDEDELAKKIRNVRYYFEDVSEYVDGKVNATSLKASHLAYFLLCPSCKEKTENVEENWVLVRTEFDEGHRLYCVKCKGKNNDR